MSETGAGGSLGPIFSRGVVMFEAVLYLVGFLGALWILFHD